MSVDTILIKDVPVFHSISDVDLEGNVIEYNGDTLRKIAKHNNYLIQDGENIPVILEHNIEGEPDKRATGWVEKFRVGVRKGVDTLFSDWRIYTEDEPKLKNFPKRSLEIAPKTGTIKAVALLARNPALSLGDLYGQTMNYSSKDKLLVTTIDNNKENNMISEELKTEIMSLLESSDVFRFYSELMKSEAEALQSESAEEKEEKVESALGEAENKGSEGEEVKEESTEAASGEEKVEGEKKEDNENEEVKEEDEGEVKEGDDLDEDEEKRKKMEEQASKYSSVEMELRQVKSENRKLQRERELFQLKDAGHEFNIKKELEGSLDLDDLNFKKHVVEKIKNYCGKAPIHATAPTEMRTSSVPNKDELNILANRCAGDRKLDFQTEYKKLFG